MKRKTRTLSAIILLVCFVTGTGSTFASQYILEVPKYPQVTNDWCGVAVAESWIQYIKGYHVANQPQIVSYFQQWILRYFVVLTNGIGADELVTVLKVYTGKNFSYDNHKSADSAVKRIINELKKDRQPLAFAGNSCYPNGLPKSPLGHWMMIEGVDLDKSDKVFQAAFVYDPLFGSAFASQYETLRPRTWVRDLFTKWWLPNNKQIRQTVLD